MKPTPRPMTKSVLAVARQAVSVAAETLPAYASKFSKKTYTQHQLFALLRFANSSRPTTADLSSTCGTGPTSEP